MDSSLFDNLQIIQVTEDDSLQCPQHSLPHQNNDQNHHVQDLDQNANLKVSTSTKPSTHMALSWSQKSKSSLTKHTIPSRHSINHENTQNKKQITQTTKELKKLTHNDKFTCQNCINEPSKTCEICQGKKELSGNDNLIKFFEYIMEFKLGKRQSYKTKQQKISSKRTNPNEHCSVFFSSINSNESALSEPKQDVRFSLCNDNSRLIVVDDEDRAKRTKQIHYNYQCDQCQCNPIEGPRYHCNTCDNYDLCETCNVRTSHYHELQKIQIKPNQKTLDRIHSLLKNNQSGIRSNIRNTCSIRNTVANKAAKSWIR